MKSGYVSIIGFPNVGKSTLLNSILKFKRSIVTSAKGTTRNKILGVYTEKDLEIVFLDSPGFYKPKNEIENYMLNQAVESIDDADLITLILDGHEKENDFSYILHVLKNKMPDVILFNKIDLYKLPEVERFLETISKYFPKVDVVQTHLTENFGVEDYIKLIKSKLKIGPSYFQGYDYLKEEEVFRIKEIIREKCLLFLKDEVPHNIALYVNGINEKNKEKFIDASIYVSKESLKGIVIGSQGQMIKKIRLNAQKDIRKNIDKKYNLKIDVRVQKDWVNDPNQLKKFGYK